MNEQKMKRKRKAEDYSLIASIIALPMVVLVFLFGTIMPLIVPHNKSIAALFQVIVIILILMVLLVSSFSFITGLKGLLFRSIGDKEKFTSYLKAFFGMGISGMLILLALPPLLFSSSFLLRPNRFQLRAKQNLAAIYTAYTSYHSDYNTYPSTPFITIKGNTYNCLNVTGWKPKGTIRYNYNCMGIEAFSPATNSSACPPEFVTSATKESFTVAACGNVDHDTTVDVWTINDAKKLKNVVDDVKL